MDKKKLLIYAHYYIPDVASTGQILKELAEGMLDQFEITVICVVPSYTGKIEEKYKRHKFFKEVINGVNVIRVRVPEFQKQNKISRIRNIMTYFFRAMLATFKVGEIDYIYSISQPPILGGLLGVWGKWVKKSKYIYNIQDFNPEQTIAVGYSKNKIILHILMKLDKFSCKCSDKVIIVGRDMIETLKNRFEVEGAKKNYRLPSYAYINNWIDETQIYPLEGSDSGVRNFKSKYGLQDKFVIMYSGNLGLYYDLENILKVIQEFSSEKNVIFAFVGEGTVKEKLCLYKQKNNMDNVVFIPYQKKEELIYSLNAADVHWCISAKGIKGVSVPSKLYGIMATAKPVLGVLEKGSEAELIVEHTGCGYIAEPRDYKMIKKIIEQMISDRERDTLKHMGEKGRSYLLQNLTKEVSINKYVNEIMSS